MSPQKWVSVAAGNPGGRARVEKGQRMGCKGVWLSFEAETQTTCDVEEVISHNAQLVQESLEHQGSNAQF